VKAARLLVVLLVAGSVALGAAPSALAETVSRKVTPSLEAWYQANPLCASPLGCDNVGSLWTSPADAVATTPYPTGSLHVAVRTGRESARTYLSFRLPPSGGTLTSAALDIPLDLASADGSDSPEAAAIQVCSFTGSLAPSRGSLAGAPAVSCDAKAQAAFVPGSPARLHADLTPLLSALASGAGLVLLPITTEDLTDSWHVVFSAHDRSDAGKTPPAVLTITGASGPVPIPTPSEEASVPPAPTGPLPPVGTSTALEPPPAAALAPSLAPQPSAVRRQARVGVIRTHPRVVWLLPLAFLILVPAVSRAITRDLTPRP
jgi:hypothetical protein